MGMKLELVALGTSHPIIHCKEMPGNLGSLANFARASGLTFARITVARSPSIAITISLRSSPASRT